VRKRFLASWVVVGALVAPPFLSPAGLLSAGFAQTAQRAAAVEAASNGRGGVEEITAEQMKAYLTFVASDEMAGRSTPSRGLDLTAKYLASQLARWGVRPAGDGGTYFQRIMLRREQIDAEKSSVEVDGKRFSFGDAFLAQPVSGTAVGGLVYVGHGWVIPSKNLNAYETSEGRLEVKDKIVVAVSGLPKGVPAADLVSGKPGVDWDNALTYAAKNGARAVVYVPQEQTLKAWSRLRERLTRPGPLRVEQPDAQAGGQTYGVLGNSLRVEPTSPPAGNSIPVITASEKLLTALFQGERVSGEEILKRAAADPVAPFALSPTRAVKLSVTGQLERVPTQNVVAVVEGADPELKQEYVAVGAHYDHVGDSSQTGCQPAGGDTICNGADDDGSGTVGVLAMAEAFAKGPRPKRSILFVWHAGEERGLWGSEYFVEHPTVPLDKIVAQLNIDMIGRSRQADDKESRNAGLTGPHEIYVIGSKMMSTELGQLSEAVNDSYLKLKFNYKYDDPRDSERLFYRSDHYNYAKKGIPIIFYFDGIHADYHRPTDEVEKIDFEKMEKVTRTVYATAWELANRAARVKVDRKLAAN
jgi:hypothetical protein